MGVVVTETGCARTVYLLIAGLVSSTGEDDKQGPGVGHLGVVWFEGTKSGKST